MTTTPGRSVTGTASRSLVRLELLVVCLAALTWLYSQSAIFSNPYLVNGDTAQHVAWMQQFRNPRLFQHDLLTTYARTIQPWGLVSFYRLGALVLDPVQVSRFLSLLLFAASALLVYRWVLWLGGRFAGFLAVSLFLASPCFLRPMVGGFARSFLYPLLILFLYLLATNRYRAASVTMVAQALVYPVGFFLSLFVYLLSFLQWRDRRPGLDTNRATWRWFIAAVALGASVLALKQAVSYDPAIGRMLTRREMVGKPEFYPQGRFRILPVYSMPRALQIIVNRRVVWLANPAKRVLGRGVSPRIASALVLVFLALALSRLSARRGAAAHVAGLLIAGALMYALADVFLFRLYHPRRYLEFAVPIAVLVVSALAAAWLMSFVRRRGVRTVCQVALLMLPLANLPMQKGNGLRDYSAHRELYRFLQGLPENTLIAAPPELADGIPLFAQRTVFLNYELSHMIFEPYGDTIASRTREFFDAYYAEGPGAIRQFCRRHGIDYLVVDLRGFAEDFRRRDGSRIYFEPFGTYVKGLFAARRNFFLGTAAFDRYRVQDGIFVVPAAAFDAAP